MVEEGEDSIPKVVQKEKTIPEVIEEGKEIVRREVEKFKTKCGRKIRDEKIRFGPSELSEST